jgi:hypothetical protein
MTTGELRGIICDRFCNLRRGEKVLFRTPLVQFEILATFLINTAALAR